MNNNVAKIEKKEFVDKEEVGSKGISYKTIGTTLQALSVQLDEGETIYSEAGKMSWMTNNVNMETKSQGCSQMFSRFFSRESIFVNKFTSKEGTGIVTFATDQAGKIIPLSLGPDSQAVVFQKGAYLCSEGGITRNMVFVKKLSAGLFGGKGFILQKVSGTGNVHLIADGEVAMYELKEGQEIAVDQGNLVAYEESVDFDIQTISGPFNWLFGGEGIFVGLLRGPGKVWLQTRKFQLGQFQSYGMRNQGTGNRLVGILISLAIFSCMFVAFILSAIAEK